MKFKFSVKNIFIGVLLILISGTIAFYNDTYLRVVYNVYDKQLRYFDHLLAGAFMPLIFYYLTGFSVKFDILIYFLWATEWEAEQFLQRGYFQIDQYSFDMLGLVLAYISFKLLFKLEAIDSKYKYTNW